MRVPASLQHEWRREPEWLAVLPALAAECAERWELELEAPIDTPHSLVVPAGAAVLKLNAPSHVEADNEADALALWDGHGAVRLLERDDSRRALLIERCVPGDALKDTKTDAAEVAVALLAHLAIDIPERTPFRRLADEAARWAEEVHRKYVLGGRPFERTLLELAMDVFADVDADAARLVNQDLHGGNILRAAREPWLVIDPKPLVGEPELDGVGLLRNAAFADESPLAQVRRWLDALASLGLDRERLRGWGAAHALAWGWDADGRWSDNSIAAARTIAAA